MENQIIFIILVAIVIFAGSITSISAESERRMARLMEEKIKKYDEEQK